MSFNKQDNVIEKKGYIYVLTNKSFKENWIKIGYAEDVNKRVKQLSGTAVPLPYEVYCTYEIPLRRGVKYPDKLVHDLIFKLNPNLRISQSKEFFELYPWDAYDMLYVMAQLHNTTDKLTRNEENVIGQELQNEFDYSTDALFPLKSKERALFEKVKGFVLSVDDHLQISPTQNYVTFKRNKSNTVSVWPKNGWVEVVLCAKLGQLKDESGLLYDISSRKWSSAQYAFKFYDDTDEAAVKDIINQTVNLKKQ